jgi:hypothetical protein
LPDRSQLPCRSTPPRCPAGKLFPTVAYKHIPPRSPLPLTRFSPPLCLTGSPTRSSRGCNPCPCPCHRPLRHYPLRRLDISSATRHIRRPIMSS